MSGGENTFVETSQNPADSQCYKPGNRRAEGPSQRAPGNRGDKAPNDEYEWRFGESNYV